MDVILSDPCDVLHRGYNYSPAWMTLSVIPLGVEDTTWVGWGLDIIFLLSLSLLPPPRRLLDLVLVLAATLSTMVVFALERANPDILVFLLVLATGLLTEYRLFMRLFGYFLGLVAALIKYYPAMVLVVAFREQVTTFRLVGLAIVGAFAVFWVEYHVDIARGLPNIARGPYNTDLFSAQNLPFLLGEVVGNATASPLVERVAATGLYAALVGACLAICWRLLRFGELCAALASLSGLERVLLVIGSAVIVGCFFAGQSVGYRGVFLLLVVPGLLTMSRASRLELRNLGLGTSGIIVLLMWSECLRFALSRALERFGMSEALVGQLQIQFWLLRELSWWWSVSVMLAVLADFVLGSPAVRSMSGLVDRLVTRAR